ncbi:hypothetical protein C7M84_006684 [Penaeus vannamei]|uniref:Chitin-binding type-4 domain-containing protein n=1 Tax=Penaeus vannamei TaxID=6689 RepID=A0A3R7STU1_PENVA|nr:hypothetical protein C7M84_006684 [Penaeus vannamei]
MRHRLMLIFPALTLLAVGVWGHGRLMDPPARNAMWRLGYPNPVNYNDNELYCGGFVVQYQQNDGMCGVCGDNYVDDIPRPHEAGGLYANGIIGRRYVINIEADLTTNHKGYMEVRLCPNNDPRKIITEDCLNQYVLPLEDTHETRFVIPQDSKKSEIFKWRVKLPEGVTCSHCVLRWKYFAGNTWGVNQEGLEGVGQGPQETFINCADVVINTQTGGFAGYPQESNQIDNPWALYFRDSFPGVPQEPKDQRQTQPGGSAKVLVVREESQVCLPIDPMREVPQLQEWCKTNCLMYPPNCDPTICVCVNECEAIGEFAKQPGADIYCHQNCLKNPPVCPKDRCKCFCP